VTGQSIGGLLADAERVEGKDLGALGMNLAYAQQDYFFGMENIYTQQKTANIQAASQRTAKPSAGGLVLGLAGSVVSGAQTAMALKAPAAGGPRPRAKAAMEVADLLIHHPWTGAGLFRILKRSN
jgi:hypothetical protein